MQDLDRRIASLSPEQRVLLEQILNQNMTGRANSDIARRQELDPIPLSYSQQSMWILDRLEPGNPASNRPANLRLSGSIDRSILARSLNEIVRRHAILRTIFPMVEGNLIQEIFPTLELDLPLIDLTHCTDEERSPQLQQLVITAAHICFDLATGPLIAVTLVRLSEVEHILLLTCHHIIFDGWSMGILLQDLAAIYDAFAKGNPSPLPELSIQYADFAAWQQQQLSPDRLQPHLNYWKQQLSGNLPILELPADYPRPPIRTYQGAKHTLVLPQSLSADLQALSQRENVTLFMLLLAAFQTLLYRYTGEEDILIGCPIAGRDRIETEPLIGIFVNTLVIRTQFQQPHTFVELLARVRTIVLAAYEHQQLPFEQLVEALNPERNLTHSSIFQVLFQLKNLPQDRGDRSVIAIEEFNCDPKISSIDLLLNIGVAPNGLICNFTYNTDLFAAESIERIAGNFQTLLAEIVANPTKSITQLPIITTTESDRLLTTWNKTQAEYPHDKCLHQLFEEQVAQNPHAIAVEFAGAQLTYGELNSRSNQLARHLQTLGVEADVLVGICMDRSLDLLVGLLGILKAGGAYVPLDPTYPSARLAQMFADAQLSILVTHQNLECQLPVNRVRVVCLDRDWQQIDRHDRSNLAPNATVANLAYTIYTSGSTGQPKGVQIWHGAVTNLLTAMRHQLGLTARDVLLSVTTISFDIAVLELYLPLIVGAKVVLASRETAMDGNRLVQLLDNSQATVMQATPATWQLLLAAGWQGSSTLKILCGGEALAPTLASQLCARATAVWNMYGPTEATVWATMYEVSSAAVASTSAATRIGKPLANIEMYILDRQLQPVPIGVPGELYIGGICLAKGYLNRPDVTAAKFIPHPFRNTPTERLYRTGDRARYLPTGEIEYLGRLDNQVKIRGFRIELGEIEVVLAKHPAVRQVIVVVREDLPGDKRIVAYLVLTHQQVGLIEELHRYVSQKLPQQMMPTAFVMLTALPLTPNGKIDRRALPAPDLAAIVSDPTTFVAPRNALERQLATIWAEVLKLERVGIHHNFFKLGGHSLIAVQLLMRIESQLQRQLDLQQLWKTPTIAEIAEILGDKTSKWQTIPQRTNSQSIPLSFTQQRLWFLEQLEPNRADYHMSTAASLTGNLNIVAIQRALDEIVAQHESLRTNFMSDLGHPVQVIRSPRSVELSVQDLRSWPQSQRDREIERLLQHQQLRPFDLERDLMLRGCVLHIGAQEYILLLVMHHIVADGWSLGVLTEQLQQLYRGFDRDRVPQLPALPIQYADFCLWQRQYCQGEALAATIAYWKQQMASAPALLSLPTDRPRPKIQTFHGSSHAFEIERSLTTQLSRLSQEAEATLFMTLLAAFDTLLYRYTGSEDLVVGIPIASRNRPELAGLIGFFANTLALRTDVAGNPSFLEVLERVKQVAVGAYTHQDLPFGVLVEELQPQRDLSYSPLFQVMFSFEEDAAPRQIELADLISTTYSIERQTAQFDLTLRLEKTADRLVGTWIYNTDLFDAGTIDRLAGHFQTLLAGIVANPAQPIASLPLLTTDELQLLLGEWSNPQTTELPDRCWYQLFEQQVEKTPHAVAVVFEGERLTYQELNNRSNQLAQYLQTLGVGADVLVGIGVERSLDLLVGLLGILKAGGAYVPLDPYYPATRLGYMLADAQISILVTQQDLVDRLSTHPARVVCLDRDWQEISKFKRQNPTSQISPAHLAYVIYTSGSTGQPKGVQITHSAVTNFLTATRQKPGLSPSDTLLSVTTISFDIAVLELYLPLIVGAKVVLASRETAMDGNALLRLLNESQATVMQATPTTWQLLLAAGWKGNSALKILCGGESLTPTLASQLVARSAAVWNMYGPTEATVWATIKEVGQCASASASPSCNNIGKPLDNIQTYILDCQLQPVPIGVPGELYLGGVGLAQGYLNRPDLTAAKFIAHPFSQIADARLYRTGDLVRYLPTGEIEYLDRLDDRVKIRGFQIELGEIEAVLATHPAVRQVAVVAREDRPGDRRLVAYIVPTNVQTELINELLPFLRQKLPQQMIPSAFVRSIELPMTPNGKIDRRSLPVPELADRLHLTDSCVAPRNSTETQLVAIWKKLLNVDNVGIHENFFDLGGHSLLAVNLFTEINKTFGKMLPLATLFQHQTIGQFATVLDSLDRDRSCQSVVKIKEGNATKPPLFFMHDVSGSVLFYQQLVNHLPSDQTCYIIQPQGLDGKQTPIDCIVQMAANYIDEILQAQPEGAYYLGGYSFGGVLAFEIARQLHERGREIGLLAIFDGKAPIRDRVRPDNIQATSQSQLSWYGERLSKFIGLNWQQRSDYLREGLRIHRTLGKLRPLYRFYLRYIKHSLPELGSIDVYWTNARVFHRYEVESSYPISVTLFCAGDRLAALATTPDLNWDSIATGGTQVHVIPGTNHATIIQEPHVRLLAEKLTLAIASSNIDSN